MLDVSRNNQIAVTRGDSFEVPLFLNAGSDVNPVRYVLDDKDQIFLGIMEPNSCFENAIVKKVYTKADFNDNEDVVIKIDHEDTACLMPGKYYYQIKAKFVTDSENDKFIVNTVVPKTEFFIEE